MRDDSVLACPCVSSRSPRRSNGGSDPDLTTDRANSPPPMSSASCIFACALRQPSGSRPSYTHRPISAWVASQLHQSAVAPFRRFDHLGNIESRYVHIRYRTIWPLRVPERCLSSLFGATIRDSQTVWRISRSFPLALKVNLSTEHPLAVRDKTPGEAP